MSELAITFVSKYDVGIPMGICFSRTVHSFLEYFSELNNANFFFSLSVLQLTTGFLHSKKCA